MKIKGLLVVFCLLISSSVWALQPAVVGGVRDGLAIGIMAEESIKSNIGIRFGAEANTGSNPLLIFCEGKFHLMDISNRYPMSLGAGLVGYLGNSSNFGVPLCLIFDKPFDQKDFFCEAGVDIVSSGRLRLQVGYKF
ncbi:MAG: hypothetical protein PHH14_03015 [Candidatus Margulisbacteria bacterium]|nr:hypothetical protein [Candidatus Margulisiibacteriota bacterium]